MTSQNVLHNHSVDERIRERTVSIFMQIFSPKTNSEEEASAPKLRKRKDRKRNMGGRKITEKKKKRKEKEAGWEIKNMKKNSHITT